MLQFVCFVIGAIFGGYFAATVDAAHNDLRMWKGDTYTYEEQTGKMLKNDEWIKV